MALPDMLGCVPSRWSRQRAQGPLTSGRTPLVRTGFAAKTFEFVSRQPRARRKERWYRMAGVGAGHDSASPGQQQISIGSGCLGQVANAAIWSFRFSPVGGAGAWHLLDRAALAPADDPRSGSPEA